MIKLAANLSFMFPELPFLDRFEAAAKAGFGAVEYAFAFDIPIREIALRVQDNGLRIILINTPRGDAALGEMGLAVFAGRQQAVADGFDRALEYAVALNVPMIHFLAGISPPLADRNTIGEVLVQNISRAADLAARINRIITVEPLNQFDCPGYYLRDNADARALIESVDRPNVKLQLDLYHCQISEGNLTRAIECNMDLLAHVQIAGVPERSEPSYGEIAYGHVLARLDSLNYDGYVGCEYRPASDTLSGLQWAAPYLHSGVKDESELKASHAAKL